MSESTRPEPAIPAPSQDAPSQDAPSQDAPSQDAMQSYTFELGYTLLSTCHVTGRGTSVIEAADDALAKSIDRSFSTNYDTGSPTFVMTVYDADGVEQPLSEMLPAIYTEAGVMRALIETWSPPPEKTLPDGGTFDALSPNLLHSGRVTRGDGAVGFQVEYRGQRLAYVVAARPDWQMVLECRIYGSYSPYIPLVVLNLGYGPNAKAFYAALEDIYLRNQPQRSSDQDVFKTLSSY